MASQGTRPSKDEYYISIARKVAARGTCLRRNYGAVIVAHDQIVSTGYNGAPRGVPNCVDPPRLCVRKQRNSPQGREYDDCKGVHAEMNAIIHAGRESIRRATDREDPPTLYLVGIPSENEFLDKDPEPCLHCWQVIVNAGVERVVAETREGLLKTTMVQEWVREASKETCV